MLEDPVERRLQGERRGQVCSMLSVRWDMGLGEFFILGLWAREDLPQSLNTDISVGIETTVPKRGSFHRLIPKGSQSPWARVS